MTNASPVDLKKIRRSISLTAVATVLCAGNVQRLMNHSTVRPVEMLSLIALGMAIGGLLFSTIFYFRVKKAQSTL